MKIEEIYKFFQTSSGVSIDTRTIKLNQIYIAIVGDNFDGNNFIDDAISKGASFVVSNFGAKFNKQHKDKVIRVENTKEVLKKLAQYHRSKFNIPVLVIGGSNGKTTTKNLISSVLEQKYTVLSSMKSYNNDIGVSLTLLNLNRKHEIAILEIGTNHPGEIKELLNISRPTHGLITSIGMEHLEGFKDLKGVKKEEGEIFKYLSLDNGFAFVNNNLPLDVQGMYKGRNKVIYNVKKNKIKSLFPIIFEYKHKNKVYKFKSNIIGQWNIENIVATIAVGEYFTISFDKILKVLEEYKPEDLRGQIIINKNQKILLDCYNSNPTSMSQLINTLKVLKIKNLNFVIGGMLEVGVKSEIEHRKIFNLLLLLRPKSIVFVGKEFIFLVKNIKKRGFYHFNTTLEAKDFINNGFFDKGAFIVVKGSRFYALERIFL
jgi:UDP-N-acetylmuramoyl-tripeptide--D-alanyl-D-alanine ligase